MRTLRFRAFRRTVCTGLGIELIIDATGRIIVYAADYPSHDVTGKLGKATIAIGAPGDCTDDGSVGTADSRGIQICFTDTVGPDDPPAYPLENYCPSIDFDVGGDIDLDGFAVFSTLGH